MVQNPSGVALLRQLRAHLHQREHEAFLTAFRSPPLQALAKVDDYVKALGGEALCLLIEDCAQPPKPLLRAYETFLLAGGAIRLRWAPRALGGAYGVGPHLRGSDDCGE